MTDMIIQSIGGIAAVYGFARILGVPKKFYLWAGIDGGIGLVPELVGDAAQPPFRAGGRGGHGQYEPEDASQESVHGRIRIGNR